MSSYQIDDLERLTGIKAHTIRIWEKRYNLIEPFRTLTNRRYYNDEQVRKLLNVATLLGTGEKISHVAAMSEAELNRRVEDTTNETSNDRVILSYINDLLASMLSLDEQAFEKIYSAAITRLGIYDAIVNVIYPFLNKVGVLWTVNKTLPVQEHFASCIIKRKLNACTDGLLPPTDTSKKFLLLLPEGEFHEIGLLFANYIIRSRGYATIYMGQNVPYENLSAAMRIVSPDYVLLFYITKSPTEEIKTHLKNILAADKKVQLLLASNEAVWGNEQLQLKRLTYFYNVADIFKVI